jgi:hypothetical protein
VSATLPCCGRPESAVRNVRVVVPREEYEGTCRCGKLVRLHNGDGFQIVSAHGGALADVSMPSNVDAATPGVAHLSPVVVR